MAASAQPSSAVIAAQPPVTAATVYDLFDVEDHSNDAAMANAISTFELSQSPSPHISVNNHAPPPGSDSKPADVNTKGTVTAQSSGLMSQLTTSL